MNNETEPATTLTPDDAPKRLKFSDVLRAKWDKVKRVFCFNNEDVPPAPPAAVRWEPRGEKQHRAWRKAMRKWKLAHVTPDGKPNPGLPSMQEQKRLTERQQLEMRGFDRHLTELE